MSQPLGTAAGNWIELIEAVELLRGKRRAEGLDNNDDLLELSLLLAGWMIHLGGQAATPDDGYARAEAALKDGSGLKKFFEMIQAQGGEISVFDNPIAAHHPGATEVVPAGERGFVAKMDTTALGWAVQRTGAGREKPGAPVDPDAGIVFHARLGAYIEKGQPLATVYATDKESLGEPVEILKRSILFSKTPVEPVKRIGRIFTRESAEKYLRDTVR
jgi:pyrimidine-nucleoside phosphorylase